MTQSLQRLAEKVSGTDRSLVIERTFNAPVAAVWKAITDKDAMKLDSSLKIFWKQPPTARCSANPRGR
jgi:uncharacterized protein YndB with AHSA1/START domain